MQRLLGAPDVDDADPEFGIKGADKEEGGARGGTRFRTLCAWTLSLFAVALLAWLSLSGRWVREIP